METAFRFALLMVCTVPLFAHDLYLVTGVSGAAKQACARVGEDFPESSNAVTADRLILFQWRPVAGEPIPLKGKVIGKQFCAPLSTSAPAIVEMTVQPRFIRLEAKLFAEYVAGEGFKQVSALRRERGAEDKDGRELYSRYSKLLFGQLGESATQPLGHVLEIVPEKDPHSLAAAEPMVLTVIFKGKPLADAQIAAVYSGAKLKGHEFPVVTRTDDQGKATLKLDRGGLWYVRLIYMEPAQNDPEIDWRSYFGTLTFSVGDGQQPDSRK